MYIHAMKIVIFITGLFFIAGFFFPVMDIISAKMLEWISLTVVFALCVGILNLLYKQLENISGRRGNKFYSLIVIMSFLATIAAIFLNTGETYFIKKNIFKKSPELLEYVVSESIENHKYFKKFPAKEKVGLLLMRSLEPRFIPAKELLHDARISLSDYYRFFRKNGEYNKTYLRKFFNLMDIEEMQKMEKTINYELGLMIDLILIKGRDLREWVDDSRMQYIQNKDSNLPDFMENTAFVNSGKELKALFEKFEVYHKGNYDYFKVVENSEVLKKLNHKIIAQWKSSFSSTQKSKIIKYFIASDTLAFSRNDGVMKWIFTTIYKTLNSTLYALLAFYIVTAAFRTLRIGRMDSTIITISALIVIVGQVPIGNWISRKIFPFGLQFSDLSDWLMFVPNLAAQRAMLIGTGVAAVYLSIKILLGIEFDKSGGNQ